MPREPNGEKRSADAIGCVAMAAQLATSEQQRSSHVSKNRRKSGVVGAEAPMKTLSAEKHDDTAMKAAQARWRRENDMTESQTAKSKLSALYAAKREAGLVDVKFLVGSIDEASFDEVANEVLRLEEAIDRGDYRVIRFNDKH